MPTQQTSAAELDKLLVKYKLKDIISDNVIERLRKILCPKRVRKRETQRVQVGRYQSILPALISRAPLEARPARTNLKVHTQRVLSLEENVTPSVHVNTTPLPLGTSPLPTDTTPGTTPSTTPLPSGVRQITLVPGTSNVNVTMNRSTRRTCVAHSEQVCNQLFIKVC